MALNASARRWLPGVDVLTGYRRSWLRGDLLTGLAVAAYLAPQVMAYAEIAGLTPQTGLWSCLGSLAVYAVLGSSRQLSVGPESTTALMTAAAVAAGPGRSRTLRRPRQRAGVDRRRVLPSIGTGHPGRSHDPTSSTTSSVTGCRPAAPAA